MRTQNILSNQNNKISHFKKNFKQSITKKNNIKKK